MKNKILRISGVGIAGFVVLMIIVVGISGVDSNHPQLVADPLVNSTVSTVPIQTERIKDPTLAPSNNVSTSTYGVRLKTSGCLANQAFPDYACTPGAILPVTTEQVCVSGYSASVRDVPDSVRKQVFQEYGISYDLHSNYEVDHLISLELGGSNDIANLFPESYLIDYGARDKDKLENYLHRQVCMGAMTLSEAQYKISHNWIQYFDNAKLTKSQPATAQVAATSTQKSSASQSTDKYYTSSYATSKYYYPSSCNAWKSLSQSNLKSFDSLEVLLAAYPSRTLSPQCD